MFRMLLNIYRILYRTLNWQKIKFSSNFTRNIWTGLGRCMDVRCYRLLVFAIKSFLFYVGLLSFIKISTFPFLFFTLMIPEKAITQMKLEIESWVHAFLFIQYSHNSEIQDSPWFKGTDLLKNWNRIQTYEWHVFWEIWINVSNTFEEF